MHLEKLPDPMTTRWIILWGGRINNEAIKSSCEWALIQVEDGCHTICNVGRYADDRDGSVFVSTVEHIVNLHNSALEAGL